MFLWNMTIDAGKGGNYNAFIKGGIVYAEYEQRWIVTGFIFPVGITEEWFDGIGNESHGKNNCTTWKRKLKRGKREFLITYWQNEFKWLICTRN